VSGRPYGKKGRKKREKKGNALEEDEGLVDLAPLSSLLLGEARVDGRHDLVEELAVRREKNGQR
jgi:hypothetical protein